MYRYISHIYTTKLFIQNFKYPDKKYNKIHFKVYIWSITSEIFKYGLNLLGCEGLMNIVSKETFPLILKYFGEFMLTTQFSVLI